MLCGGRSLLHLGMVWRSSLTQLGPQHLSCSSIPMGTLAFGGYWNGAWFSQPWPPHLAAKPIEWKELYAIVIACEVWGSHWSGKRILFHCDNLAIVRIWESGLSRCSDLMYLVRALFLVAAHNNFNVLIRHVLGTNSCIADALSRLQLPRFCALAPEVSPYPTPIPANLTFC